MEVEELIEKWAMDYAPNWGAYVCRLPDGSEAYVTPLDYPWQVPGDGTPEEKEEELRTYCRVHLFAPKKGWIGDAVVRSCEEVNADFERLWESFGLPLP